MSWSRSKAFAKTRSHRLKICVPRGLGGLPSTSAWGYLDSHRHRLPLLFANNIRILYTMIYFYYHSRNKYIINLKFIMKSIDLGCLLIPTPQYIQIRCYLTKILRKKLMKSKKFPWKMIRNLLIFFGRFFQANELHVSLG